MADTDTTLAGNSKSDCSPRSEMPTDTSFQARKMGDAQAKLRSVDELDIPDACKRHLSAGGFKIVGQLLPFCRKMLQLQPNLGSMTVCEVRKALKKQGLHLAKCRRPGGVLLCSRCKDVLERCLSARA